MSSNPTAGSIPLVLAAIALGAAVYMQIWSNDHNGSDQAAVLVLGAIAIGLLVLGLVRRYQPRAEGQQSAPRRDDD